ncbi:hypothetical protein Trisim1_007483 [Trichoderma cf. simile WF8]
MGTGSVPAIGSPQRHKLRELCSRAILEQATCNGAANMPGIDLGVEAESYMMDVPHVASWVQPDNASNLLFNPGEMNLPVFDVNIDAVNPLDQTCCPDLTPELPSGWDDSLVGFDGSGNWYNAEYSEMTSPSSQAESIDLTDASLSHDFLNQLI